MSAQIKKFDTSSFVSHIRVGVFVLLSCGLAVWFGRGISQGQMIPAILTIGVVVTLLLFNWKVEKMVFLWLFLAMGMQWWNGVELGAGVPNITVDRYLILVAILIVFLRWDERRNLGNLSLLILLVSGIYILYTLVALLLRAVSLREELLVWFSTVFMPLLTLFLGLQVKADDKWWQTLFSGVPFVVLYLFLPALYEQITRMPFLPSGWLVTIAANVEGVRSASLAGEAVTLSYSTVLLLPLTIYPFAIERTQKQRYWDFIIFIANLATVYMSGYRTAWVAAAVVLIIAVLLLPRARPFLLRLILLGGLLFGVFSNQILSSAYTTDRVLDPTNLYFRMEAFNVQIQRASKNLLFGEGGTAAWNVEGSWSGVSGTIVRASHNNYATILLYYGLIGLLLYLSVWGITGGGIFVVWRKIRGVFYTPPVVRLNMLSLVIVAAIVTAAGHDMRFFVTNNCLLGFSIGLCVQQAELVYGATSG